MATVYAVYFAKDSKPGHHWRDDLPEPEAGERRQGGRHKPPADDSDRKQHWKKGELYSESSTPVTDLHPQFATVAVEKADGQVWNPKTHTFEDRPVPTFTHPDAKALYDAGFQAAALFLDTHKTSR